MTLYVGSNKIKDVSTHGVYVGSQNTNCLTYVPKNINLTLSNGTLTLKAGSKVYVPNGAGKFDVVTISNDLINQTFSTSGTTFIRYENGMLFCDWAVSAFSSGSDSSTVTGWYYDTSKNEIKYYENGVAHNHTVGLPLGIATVSNGVVNSIDQIFDWCGYIGFHQFFLPGIKGLKSNGLKADGTYNNIEVETKSVILNQYTYQAINQQVAISNNGKEFYRTDKYYYQATAPAVAAYSVWHNTKDNFNYFIGDDTSTGWVKTAYFDFPAITNISTDTSYRVTSITPATVKPSTTTIPINAIYNGSQLVYQYNSYNPNQVLVNITNGQTATITLKKGVYRLYITGGGGTGGTSYAANGVFYTTSGGSGSTWEGTFKLTEDTAIEAFGCRKDADSYLNIGGVRMITAGGGRLSSYPGTGGHPEGGTLTLANGWNSYVVTTDKAVNGNNGASGAHTVPNGGTTTSSLKWGEGTTLHTDGAVQYGGVRIVYLRYEV